MADAVTRASALLMALGLGAAASAAGVVDPTRPPPGYGAPQPAGDPQSPDPLPEPVRLQMIARDGSQHMAVLNGRRVRPGDAITLDGKSVKVVAIRESAPSHLDHVSRYQPSSGGFPANRPVVMKPRIRVAPRLTTLTIVFRNSMSYFFTRKIVVAL